MKFRLIMAEPLGILTLETNNPIFVKLMDGKIQCLSVESTYTTRKLIRMLQATLDDDMIMNDARLSYGGTPMEDDFSLDCYNVKAEATLFLNGSLLGGGLDHEKYLRLGHLFIHTIHGLPNYNILMDRYNKLVYSMTVADLKDYDATYPPPRL